jgi:hypothetical protein
MARKLWGLQIRVLVRKRRQKGRDVGGGGLLLVLKCGELTTWLLNGVLRQGVGKGVVLLRVIN